LRGFYLDRRNTDIEQLAGNNTSIDTLQRALHQFAVRASSFVGENTHIVIPA
jgi:hypothetical protein